MQFMGQEAKINFICGLGNPGSEYAKTRHNAGFQVVDRMVEVFHVAMQQRKFKASWGTGNIEGQKILVVKPLTYMNRSGEALVEILNYFGISAEQMLVVHDDLDLPTGRVRLAAKGGAGGHRGISSIIQHLGNQDFPRLKLGIGRPLHGEAIEHYVLQAPYPEEALAFAQMVERGFKALQTVLSAGLVAAMNQYNRHEQQD